MKCATCNNFSCFLLLGEEIVGIGAHLHLMVGLPMMGILPSIKYTLQLSEDEKINKTSNINCHSHARAQRTYLIRGTALSLSRYLSVCFIFFLPLLFVAAGLLQLLASISSLKVTTDREKKTFSSSVPKRNVAIGSCQTK
jgi:hypothetical protein